MESGFTFLKMDIGIRLLKGIEGAISAPEGMLETTNVMHPFTGIHLTDKGVALENQLTETQRQLMARAYREAGAEAVEGYRKVLAGLIDEGAWRGPERASS